MPTAYDRLSLTETPDIVEALKVAQLEWPDAARATQAARLIKAGAHAIQVQRDADTAAYQAALNEASGFLTGAYEPDYLDKLRSE
jgi:hypothetical protein